MSRNYADEPGFSNSEWLRYVIFACVVVVLLMLFTAVRLAQAMVDDLHWLRDIMPPVADLFFLILLIVFCLKTLTIWAKTTNHPRRHQMRTLITILLAQNWIFFFIGSYAEALVRWWLVTYS